MEECARILTGLYIDYATLSQREKAHNHSTRNLIVKHTEQFLERIGIQLDDLESLSAIHVSGTKGKGSTCAFSESILRASGYKTGFFSSPHLVDWRERIRINGRPLTEEKFVSYFWEVYNKLVETKASYDGVMPTFFRFMFVMAVRVFLSEKVDVSIIEVGVGGQCDSTNVLRATVVCGVTSLGMDHLYDLGGTMDQIAWNKAGIFKPGVPAFSVPQTPSSHLVFLDRAKEIGNPIYQAPELDSYDWGDEPVTLGIQGNVQRTNASLALQLCKTWIQDHDKSYVERRTYYQGQGQAVTPEAGLNLAPTFKPTAGMRAGLRDSRWPGRAQTISRKGLTYYLDGAHTPESMEQCVKWFVEKSEQERDNNGRRMLKVLLFNATGDRSAETLLQMLSVVQFDRVAFCPNISKVSAIDDNKRRDSVPGQLTRCESHRSLWLQCMETSHDARRRDPERTTTTTTDAVYDGEAVNGAKLKPESHVKTFQSIEEGLRWLTSGRDALIQPQGSILVDSDPRSEQRADHIQILCTGSLHLVGGAIKVIEPNRYEDMVLSLAQP